MERIIANEEAHATTVVHAASPPAEAHATTFIEPKKPADPRRRRRS